MMPVLSSYIKHVRFAFLCRVLSFVSSALLLPSAAFPQSASRQVTGTVADCETGKAVPYVTVKALNAADSLLSYAMTGGDGTFTLRLDGNAAALEFTLLGYERKRIGAKDARQGAR